MARKFEPFDWFLVAAITCFLVAFSIIGSVGLWAAHQMGLI